MKWLDSARKNADIIVDGSFTVDKIVERIFDKVMKVNYLLSRPNRL